MIKKGKLRKVKKEVREITITSEGTIIQEGDDCRMILPISIEVMVGTAVVEINELVKAWKATHPHEV